MERSALGRRLSASPSIRHPAAVLSLTLAGGLAFGVPAVSANDWICADDFWTNAGCWSTGAPPFATDDALLGNGDVVRIDPLTGAAVAASLRIGADTASVATLVQTGGTLNVNGQVLVGYGIDSVGTYTLAGGALEAGYLVLAGPGSASQGTFNLGGTGSVEAGAIDVGNVSVGAFNQDGGTTTIAGALTLAVNGAASSGTYNLNAGTLSADSASIGGSGTGIVNQNGGAAAFADDVTLGTEGLGTWRLNGGTLAAAGMTNGTGTSLLVIDGGTLSVGGGNGSIVVDELRLGDAAGRTGAHTLSGSGSLTAVTERIGRSGTGSVTQTGGTHVVSLDLYLGQDSGSNGSYNLVSGGLTGQYEFIGISGTGTFSQTGGAHTVLGELYLGGASGGIGSYDLTAGTLTAGNVYIGFAGTGILTQSGGTAAVSDFALGQLNGSVGSYELAGGSLTARAAFIGYVGTGTVTQTGGAHTVSGGLNLGEQSGGAGTYRLNGGTLSVAAIVNGAGTGLLVIDGGTLSVGGGNGSIGVDGLYVGDAAGRTGAHSLAGTGSIVAATVGIGLSGNGSLVQTGGSLHAQNGLVLGAETGGAGSYQLDAGTLRSYGQRIGHLGTGTFVQNGGTNTVDTELALGGFMGAVGHYALHAGMLNVAFSEIIGEMASGSFEQTGGLHQVGGDLVLGTGAVSGGTGTYLLNGGTLDVSGSGEINRGDFTQTGGSHVVAGLLTLNEGTYRLDGGTASAGGILNGGASGLLVIDGGTLTVDGGNGLIEVDELRLGDVAGRAGAHTLAGAAILTATTLIVGNDGTGTFTQAGGTHTVAGTLTIAAHAGADGTYTLAGGTLSVGLVDNNDTFTQTGGSFAGVLRNDAGFTYSGGSFLGRLVNNANVTLTTDFTAGDGLENNASFPVLGAGRTLTLNGAGLVNNGDMTVAGGTLAGTGVLTNAALLSGHGTIAGSGGFVNIGLFSQGGGNVTLANTGFNRNTGLLDLAGGQQFNLAAPGVNLTNSGTLNLDSGTLGGTGFLMNAAGGVITGRGTIGALFGNQGVLEVASGTTTVTQGFANGGTIDLTSAAATLAGGQILNASLVSGRGTVQNAMVNDGTLRPLGGRLTLTGSIINNGTIEIGAGSEFLTTQGLGANLGTLALAGGRFDNGGHALINSDTVTGHGTFVTGALSNAGEMLFSTAASDVHGGVVGHGGSRIVVSGGGLTFHDAFELQAGAELRVTEFSTATFFGEVALRDGSILTGTGTKYYEAGLTIGNSPGAAFDAGNVSFGAGNTYEAEIAGLLQGDTYDYLDVGGTLTLGGTLKLTLLDGYVPVLGDRYDLLDWGFVVGAFAGFDTAAAVLGGGLAWDFSRIGVDGTVGIVAAPVPLPGSVWLLGSALGVLAGGLRRRHATT